MKLGFVFACLCLLVLNSCGGGNKKESSHSVARQWNEVLLEAIRNDFARPTVHARNLFHISAAMYDAWAYFSERDSSYLLGLQVNDFICPLNSSPLFTDSDSAKESAVSYAAYRLIQHRFERSPGTVRIYERANELMDNLGLDRSYTSVELENDDAAALGNYIAQCYIEYGLQDGANEINEYSNRFYQPINPVIEPELPGNPNIVDLNRWQAISLTTFIDQAGNPVNSSPQFLSPEWGSVKPFSLTERDMSTYTRDGDEYFVYFDPGSPPTIDGILSDEYKWNFLLVALWAAQLDPNDSPLIDISPNAIGNFDSALFPDSFENYRDFYQTEGGDISEGRTVNPVTGVAYDSQYVPLGDYARVLAEFWADGPDSETPPGHWFVILNVVSDHPGLEKKIGGQGLVVSDLEWDIKAYFTLGGAMHDAAISAWSIKGWYDYIRPVSAIRAMADRGQSISPDLPSYHIDGLPLVEGKVALIEAGDPLVGDDQEHLNKIKIYSWRGPDYIEDTSQDVAGVGWIRAENWWPYQRPTFVTPPFAGYVSGHSTYSRAAAEVLTRFTGSEFFPGGLGEFVIPANDFLVFERGPSVNLRLQWATYRDASDQCSLSRIWGGIHPPADDIPGRIIGETLGVQAYDFAASYFAN